MLLNLMVPTVFHKLMRSTPAPREEVLGIAHERQADAVVIQRVGFYLRPHYCFLQERLGEHYESILQLQCSQSGVVALVGGDDGDGIGGVVRTGIGFQAAADFADELGHVRTVDLRQACICMCVM